MIPASRQGGYTLLEVVVALAILAASIGALSESFSLSLRRSQRAENFEQAALLLASIRDRLGTDIPLDGSTHTDRSGNCSWSVASKEVPRPSGETEAAPHAWQAHIETDCGEGSAAREASLELLALAGAGR